MTGSNTRLRAVVAVPLPEELCRLIEELEPRLDVIRDHALYRPMRGPADWSGDPAATRTPDEQQRFDAMVDSADVLFGIPDVDPAALARTVAANPALRWVMTTAAGGGAQVKAAGLSRDGLDRIAFTTSAGVHGSALAEFAVFAVLAGAKNLPRLLRDQHERMWPDRWEMRQLDELTVLVVGLGGIGVECARRFSALGATVWGTTRTGTPVDGVDRLVPIKDLADAAGSVDAVVVTLPGTEQTHHLVGADVLGAVAPGTVFASVGRGTVVDERALLTALDEGRISFAALDVFEVEPLPEASPIWTLPNVIVTPHSAADSDVSALFAHVERQIDRFERGEALEHVVARGAGY